jgi:hypothetical protein
MKNSLRLVFALAFAGVSVTAGYLFYQNKELKRRIPAEEPPTSAGECRPINTGPMNWLTIKEAVKMVRAYGENQGRNIDMGWNRKLRSNTPGRNETDSFVDSRYIVFPMDTIKKFIKIIEAMLAQGSPLNDNGTTIRSCDLGIRFYYAAYDSLAPQDKINETYKARHTLVLVPAYLNSRGDIYEDFFPMYKQPSGRPEKIVALPARELNGSFEDFPILAMRKLNDIQSLAKNHGTLCPPPKPCASEILDLASKPPQE